MGKKRIAIIVLWSLLATFHAALALSAAPEEIPGEYIMKLKPRASLMSLSKAGFFNAAEVKPLTPGGVLHLKLRAGERLPLIPEAEYLEPNYRIRIEPLAERKRSSSSAEQWALARIQLPELLKLALPMSQEITVAVIDTGIDWEHPDLKSRIFTNAGEIAGNGLDDDRNGYVDDVHGWNALDESGDSRDDNSHGTHVAGIIGAGGGVGFSGVAQKVKLVPVKCLDKEGSGSTAQAIAAIEYARRLGVRIMNNSWGGYDRSQALEEAVKTAEKDGIVFVAAAGNDRMNNDWAAAYPASIDAGNVISVAATDSEDRFADFFPGSWKGSNYGVRSVHVAAPGSLILSTVPGGEYAEYSGTSMAAPHVTGIAALMLSVRPDLTPQELRRRLLESSDKLDGLARRVSSGGRVNALKAVEASLGDR